MKSVHHLRPEARRHPRHLRPHLPRVRRRVRPRSTRPTLARPGAFEVANPAYPGIVGRLQARAHAARRCRRRASRSRRPGVRRRRRARRLRAHRGRRLPALQAGPPLRRGRHHHGLRPEARRIPPGVPLAACAGRRRSSGCRASSSSRRAVGAVGGGPRASTGASSCPGSSPRSSSSCSASSPTSWRWQILLAGSGHRLTFGFLCRTYFIGRFFGIVTPTTLGLDGWRLYETIRLTRKPVECTTVLAVERVIGLVGLLAVILLFMPFAGRITQGPSLGDVVEAMTVPLGAAGLRLAAPASAGGGSAAPAPGPGRQRPRVREQRDRAAPPRTRAGGASSAGRARLAIFGQITTMAMYFGNAMAAPGSRTCTCRRCSTRRP